MRAEHGSEKVTSNLVAITLIVMFADLMLWDLHGVCIGVLLLPDLLENIS